MHTLEPLVSSISVFIKKPKIQKHSEKPERGGMMFSSFWLSWKQQLQAGVMVAFEHSTTLDWVGWVLTFGYRNWIIILGVTPPVGISSSHYGALLIGLAKSNLLICFASWCSFKGSFALCWPFSTCPYLLCRPSQLYQSTWWFIKSFNSCCPFRVEWWRMP